MPKFQKKIILLVVILLSLLVLFFVGNKYQWFTLIEELTPTPSPEITGTDPGVLARIAENAGNIKVLESRLNALSGIDSRVTANTSDIKDLQSKMAALSVSQTQMLVDSI
jgi:hypothetical protein